MKREVGLIDATPNKRLYASIIADYDMNLAICELIDNALDIWTKSETSEIEIKVDLNLEQQLIRIVDNAGGLKKEELRVIVSPGHTTNLPDDEVIGIFGVGSKRAVIALAQEIVIKTHHKGDLTYQIEIHDDWLDEETWFLPVYEVRNIPENVTIIELKKLRDTLKESDVVYLRKHLEEAYGKFLIKSEVKISLNESLLKPTFFENWAFPPDYPPIRYKGKIKLNKNKTVNLEIISGLILESSPIQQEYGYYFYCNERLVIKHSKDFELGYKSGLAGKPHPNVALVRIIVSLNGPAELMPWNSSKSGLNHRHETLLTVQNFLIEMLKEMNKLSRILESDWPESVFKYKKGEINEINIPSLVNFQRTYRPPLPKSKLRYSDKIRMKNEEIGKRKPWVKGLFESIIAVDLIFKHNLEQKNRICLIILDSTVEIGIKEYLVHEIDKPLNEARLLEIFKQRNRVHTEVKKHINFTSEFWKQIEYYYKMRCDLIHRRTITRILDSEIQSFRTLVEALLEELYSISLKIEKT